VWEKKWADVKDAYGKYSTYLPGAAPEVQAEFEVWIQHWERDVYMEKPHTSKVSTSGR